MTRSPFFLLFALFAPVACLAEEIDFARDIRPILSENCFFCHGPDADQREADLRLDTADGAATVIASQNRTASELFQRLVSDDDARMPPPESNRTLTEAQIGLIGQWIDAGAPWETHWSFRPLERPEVPQATATFDAPRRNPIDAFVQQKLVGTSLLPSPEANRRTLIRRLSLDLTGLPPAPNEVDAFLNDASSDAYEKVVARLLDSPAYGERMTWDWLDAARYADTNGYQGDNERTMWPWRDWVVSAFNQNLPYDQFTTWQIAGDLIADATDEQILATGFFRNHMINGEGGRIPEENRVEYVMDMSETMGTVWLGLTLNCCRCHDHKFDPLTNEDYYQLFAFFNQTPVKGNGGDAQTAPVLATPSPQERDRLESFDRRIKALDAELAEISLRASKGLQAWEDRMCDRLAGETRWQVLVPSTMFATGAALRKLSDDSILASNKNTDNDTYTLVAPTQLKQITGLRLETLQHSSLTGKGLSRSPSGNFVLTSIEVSVVEKVTDGEEEIARTTAVIESAIATLEQDHHTIDKAFDGDQSTGWAVYKNGKVDQPQTAIFRFAAPMDVPSGAEIEIVMRHDSRHKQHNIGCFRLAVTKDSRPKISEIADVLYAALNTDPKHRSAEQLRVIGKAYRESIPEYQSIQRQRDAIESQRAKLKSAIPKVMVMADQDERRKTFMLERGLYNKPTVEVDAALPAFLLPNSQWPRGPAEATADQTVNRATLADWLVSPSNPLTARVTVNRLWQQLFGIGLVKTTEDFGVQGEIPIQMDLLNWLAAEFRDSHWDVKNLVRLIVESHTYRQSSKLQDADTYERDPANRHLARGARYRMPSWMIRDQALAASGLLSNTLGGAPVNTYQPPGIWEEASFGKKSYVQDSGEKLYRRSLYIFWRRIIAPTMLFDAASRQNCTVKVSRTNTPLHALQTLNDVTYIEASRALAERVLTEHTGFDSRKRLDVVMNRVLARDASEDEAKILLDGLDRTTAQFKHAPQRADEFLRLGESTRDENVDPIVHASWTALCLAVLNMDEALNRE